MKGRIKWDFRDLCLLALQLFRVLCMILMMEWGIHPVGFPLLQFGRT